MNCNFDYQGGKKYSQLKIQLFKKETHGDIPLTDSLYYFFFQKNKT